MLAKFRGFDVSALWWSFLEHSDRRSLLTVFCGLEFVVVEKKLLLGPLLTQV